MRADLVEVRAKMTRLWAVPFAWLWAGVGAWCAVAWFSRWPLSGNSAWGGPTTGYTVTEMLSDQGFVVATILLSTVVAVWITFARSANNLDAAQLARILALVWVLPAALPLVMLVLMLGPVIGIGMSPPLIMALVAAAGFWATALIAGWAPLKRG